ncbi:hypothetical protein PoMZ_11273, partial [Pyricularia oryzae]
SSHLPPDCRPVVSDDTAVAADVAGGILGRHSRFLEPEWSDAVTHWMTRAENRTARGAMKHSHEDSPFRTINTVMFLSK